MNRRHQRIYLTGYRGTGKTTVGQLISKGLGIDCLDLDDVIEMEAGMTIREVFDQGGESLFRELETVALKRVAADDVAPRVISLGGGAILRQENRDVIGQTGVCIWLTASAETIAARIIADETTGARRPSLTSLSPAEEIEKLLADREPLYRDAADLTLSTDSKSPEQLSREVIEWLGRS